MNHSIEYADSEGVIPTESYGSGSVEIWDKRTHDIEELGDNRINILYKR